MIPLLPHSGDNDDTDQKCRRHLEMYLQAIQDHPVLRTSRIFTEFMTNDCDDFPRYIKWIMKREPDECAANIASMDIAYIDAKRLPVCRLAVRKLASKLARLRELTNEQAVRVSQQSRGLVDIATTMRAVDYTLLPLRLRNGADVFDDVSENFMLAAARSEASSGRHKLLLDAQFDRLDALCQSYQRMCVRSQTGVGEDHKRAENLEKEMRAHDLKVEQAQRQQELGTSRVS